MDAIVNAAITFLKSNVPDRPLDVSEMRAKETAGLMAHYEKIRQKEEVARSRKQMAEKSQDASNSNAVGVL